MQGVCHPFPLDSLKGCVGAEAIPIYCLCILATLRLISAQAHPQLVPHLPYRSRQHSHLWLECFPPQRTSVSVATASATSFLSSAVMYLWGQLLRIRMVICMCRANTPSIGRQRESQKYEHFSKFHTLFTFTPLSSRQRKCPERAIILKKHLSPQLSGDENERKSSHPLIFNCELFCKKTNKFVKINYPFDR